VGGAPDLVAGAWADDSLDRRWRAPSPAELRHDIDHFHLAPPDLANRESWAEWQYFNVLSADRRRWAFLSFIVGGEVPDGRWGGQLLLTLHEQGGSSRRFSTTFEPERIRLSTDDANLRFGDASVTVLDDGRYAVRGVVAEERGGRRATVDLTISPAPGAYFPGMTIGEEGFLSGYAVPALRADASGSICIEGEGCERYDRAQAYHDHNWGTWRGVTWEWGAARAGAFTFLYGRVEAPDTVATETPLFLYLVDSLGFRALFRPREVRYVDDRITMVDGRPVRTPSRAVMADIRGDDTLRVELEIEDATGTDTRRPLVERGESLAARELDRPYFLQMKGIARISGRVGGAVVRGEGAGFFETYR
jgi:hypothetical protein